MRSIEGLKVGLEIHQQVGRLQDAKLFCACPATIVERQPDLIVQRSLRASAGETGMIDAAAAAEAAKGKRYIYHAFRDATCLVELDEEPPHPVNEEVLRTAIMVAKACGSEILPRVQFMRKTIVDGSATAGFQRTGLFALGGMVPEVEPKVRIQTICVEEDSAKIISKTGAVDTYNLSRLGVPLIEIATEPDITTPQHAQEVAAALGMILRSTKRVRRGLGTIRQDLNVSIPGGTRVEIKGAQDLRMIPTIIEYEALRQQRLLELQGRFAELRPGELQDVTSVFQSSTVGFVKSAIAKGDKAIGLTIENAQGLFGTELLPNYRVGSDLADVARNQGFGGLIHSDEDLKKYGVTKDDLNVLGESFIILIGNKEHCTTTLQNFLVPRLQQFAAGIPSEVRKANPDGTTSFLRPMPGASRMYPETDVPVLTVTTDGIRAPKLFSEQVRDLQKLGLNEEQAKLLVRQGILFEEYLERYPSLEPTFMANALLTYGKEIQARYKKEIDHVALLEPLFEAVVRNEVPKSAVFEILVEIAEGKTTISKLDFSKYAPISDDELRAIIGRAIAEMPGAKSSVIMGKVMAQARGKADGKRVLQLIEEEQRRAL